MKTQHNGPKVKVGIIFGGKSAEHEISVKSATAIFKHLDRHQYDPYLIYIDKQGLWGLLDIETFTTSDCEAFAKRAPHSVIPWEHTSPTALDCDIYFPVLHGPNGEDGKIPALLEMAGKPYVGANSFASALAMDKGVAKQLFREAGLDTPDFVILRKPQAEQAPALTKDLSYPLFVKPCSLGSSVGISKAKDDEELLKAVKLAFQYDRKIIIEQGIDAREIEIAVMGNDTLEISPPGELVPANEFYDYADKYIDGKTTFNIPVPLPETVVATLKDMAQTAYHSLFLNGLSRIDFFLEKKSEKIYINEINTMPGFTEISMFPKLFALEGISFSALVSRLIQYGFDYHNQ